MIPRTARAKLTVKNDCLGDKSTLVIMQHLGLESITGTLFREGESDWGVIGKGKNFMGSSKRKGVI